MDNKIITMDDDPIQSLIITVSGQRVLIDNDLASLYAVLNKVLNPAVKRNLSRFPPNFRFQLTAEEVEDYETNLRSQVVTSSLKHGGRRYHPYVFTEQGVSMLSAVLSSKTAVVVSIQIMDAFVTMRRFITNNALLFQRLDKIE